MAIDNPFKITYGTREIGGDSDKYQLHGPHVLEKTFDTFRLVFDVVVVAPTRESFQNYCDELETDFRKRDQNLTIDLDAIADEGGASTWTYSSGSTILNSTATITKTGNPQTDRGLSRAYTVVVEGGLPADDASPVSGLRDIAWHVAFEAGRQRIMTAQGVYTAGSAGLASVNYLHANGADAEASTFLAALDGSATFELVPEEYTPDRNDHECSFKRQYLELLSNRGEVLDDTEIRDHRMVFRDLSQHPGDSYAKTHRLRRVTGNYDCAIDIEETTDLQTVFTAKVFPRIKSFFTTTFTPAQFCVEDKQVSYDETTKRMSVAIQFLYQKKGGGAVVEATESGGFRESRTIDYTPVHGKDELGMYADPGWVVLEYVFARTFTIAGPFPPSMRVANSNVSKSGWNIISNDSRATPRYIGDPDDGQMHFTVLNENIVYRYNRIPNRTAVPPTTPSSKPKAPETGSSSSNSNSKKAGSKVGPKTKTNG